MIGGNVVNNNYKKAYAEVSYILKQLEEENLKKIPANLLKLIEKEKDKNYKINITLDTPIYEQNLLRETKAVLAVIYRLYLAI